MPRNADKGLSYAYLDVNMLSDRKVKRLRRRAGKEAPFIFIALLSMIFREGYYIEWDEDTIIDLSEITGYDESYITNVVNCCLDVELLSRKMFDQFGVITSFGIQRRYSSACQKMKRKSMIDKFSLMEDFSEETDNEEDAKIPSENKPIIRENNPIIPELKDHKGDKEIKEIKKNNSSCCSSLPEDPQEEKTTILKFFFLRNWPCPAKEVLKFYEFNNSEGRRWSDMSPRQKLKSVNSWKQSPELNPRFSEEELALWRDIIEAFPSDRQIDLLGDDCISAEAKGGSLYLSCRRSVQQYIDSEARRFKKILAPHMKIFGTTNIQYLCSGK